MHLNVKSLPALVRKELYFTLHRLAVIFATQSVDIVSDFPSFSAFHVLLGELMTSIT